MKLLLLLCILAPIFCFCDAYKIEREIRKCLCESIIESQKYEIGSQFYWYWIGKKEGIYEALIIAERYEYKD